MPIFREKSLQSGHHAAVVPVSRLDDLRRDIEADLSASELDGLQGWITGSYEYVPANMQFKAKSVVCVALPRPSYGEVVFEYAGRSYKLYAVDTPFSRAGEDYVKTTLNAAGFSHVKASGFFPRKRFAVQSGLAVYGRNNVTYVQGFGSYVDYAVLFTDMPPDEDNWRSVVTAASCEGCGACIKSCPTGAIRPERFMIESVKCLAALNEGGPPELPSEFPDFVPRTAHHTLFDCMRCQFICPMNAEVNVNTYRTVFFTEGETERLLQGAPYDNLGGDLLRKYELFEMKYTKDLPRNLRACFDLIDSGTECSLK